MKKKLRRIGEGLSTMAAALKEWQELILERKSGRIEITFPSHRSGEPRRIISGEKGQTFKGQLTDAVEVASTMGVCGSRELCSQDRDVGAWILSLDASRIEIARLRGRLSFAYQSPGKPRVEALSVPDPKDKNVLASYLFAEFYRRCRCLCGLRHERCELSFAECHEQHWKADCEHRFAVTDHGPFARVECEHCGLPLYQHTENDHE